MERAEISARAKTDFVSRALTVLVLANKSAEIRVYLCALFRNDHAYDYERILNQRFFACGKAT